MIKILNVGYEWHTHFNHNLLQIWSKFECECAFSFTCQNGASVHYADRINSIVVNTIKHLNLEIVRLKYECLCWKLSYFVFVETVGQFK